MAGIVEEPPGLSPQRTRLFILDNLHCKHPIQLLLFHTKFSTSLSPSFLDIGEWGALFVLRRYEQQYDLLRRLRAVRWLLSQASYRHPAGTSFLLNFRASKGMTKDRTNA